MKRRYLSAESFSDYLERPKKFGELWESLYARAVVPPDILERIQGSEDEWHMLVLSEDWCGDSLNVLPLVAKLADIAPWLDMRILSRDENPDLMEEHLTGTSRSIPVIILLDSNYVERGWWGPRPRALQKWVREEGLSLPKDDRYRQVRTWYARDRGKTALNELLDIIEATTSRA
jgi:hypothetical protein